MVPVDEQGLNTDRLAQLVVGWEDGVSSVLFNRMWGSSQQAINFAAGRICGWMYHVLVASGVEHMAIHPD